MEATAQPAKDKKEVQHRHRVQTSHPEQWGKDCAQDRPSKLVIGTKPSDRGTIDKFRAPNGMRTSVIYINTCHRE